MGGKGEGGQGYVFLLCLLCSDDTRFCLRLDRTPDACLPHCALRSPLQPNAILVQSILQLAVVVVVLAVIVRPSASEDAY
jgi:hypothetical protein